MSLNLPLYREWQDMHAKPITIPKELLDFLVKHSYDPVRLILIAVENRMLVESKGTAFNHKLRDGLTPQELLQACDTLLFIEGGRTSSIIRNS